MNRLFGRWSLLPASLAMTGVLGLAGCGSGDTPLSAPLQARDDTATVDDGATMALDVLANDQGQGLTLSSVGTPTLGTATIEAGRIRYVPRTDALGTDSFSYQVRDAQGSTQQATVSLTLRRGLALEGQVLLAGQAQASRAVDAVAEGQTLGSTQSDASGSFRLQVWFTDAAQLDRLLRLQLKESSAQPLDRAELYLAAGSTLLKLAGTSHKLDATRLTALRVDDVAIGEASLLLSQYRSLTGLDAITDEPSLRRSLTGYSLETLAERTALVQAARRKLVALPSGFNTVAQMLADDAGLRQFRAAAQTSLGTTLTRLQQDVQDGLGSRSPFTSDTVGSRYILAPVAALDQAPVFGTPKYSSLLTLSADGTGLLRPRQSFAVAHGALRWTINAQGALVFSGSGTEVLAGTDIFDFPYHEYLQSARRVSRLAFGDVLLLGSCAGQGDCGPGDASAATGTQLSLALTESPLTLQAAEIPGRWFLPIGETKELRAHQGVGPLRSQPLDLQADGTISGRSWRWHLEDGTLVIENGSTQRWRLQLMQRSAARQFLMHAQYEGPEGLGASLGEAYVQDPSLAWQRSDLVGEWRIDRLVRTLQLRANGSAGLQTHHDTYEGSWQLAPDGSVQVLLGDSGSEFVLQWWGLSSDKLGTLVVEGGYAMSTPDQRYTNLPLRYERVAP